MAILGTISGVEWPSFFIIANIYQYLHSPFFAVIIKSMLLIIINNNNNNITGNNNKKKKNLKYKLFIAIENIL